MISPTVSHMHKCHIRTHQLNVLERQEVSGKHQWKELEEEEEAEELIEESDSDEDETSGGYTDSESHSD